ncbi:NIPSNAP family protein [Sediminibacterium sp.]|uniref:NIPSNAP family protein n=1 Tax=Sediminibacterium sp. TaxID=1917865 RepID=UPI0027341040|nr:NIPSNAP family protein [Sediminibacterium sp.]MDP3392238.1 NIPSNAP family protein [Sediminibacterium sp.]MDP3566960.1 NIPSNAP family protein [Sediminibacterium sp.]
MKKLVFIFILLFANQVFALTTGEFYKLIVYHFSTVSQEKSLDNFIEQQYLPALHKSGFKQVGVFKPITNDTAIDKQILVLVGTTDINKLMNPIQWSLNENSSDKEPIYNRYEQFLLKAFKGMPFMKVPTNNNIKAERIYELRSYESPTEEKYLNKVHMFNDGGEIKLFNELQFNAVFYADVLFGSKMPNLMYMTSFDNLNSRNEHWNAFGESSTWKKLSKMPFYQNNMSGLHSQLMRSTTYSDY